MSKVKIAFVGLYDEQNLGDPIIFDCTEWLYRKYVASHEIESQRLYLDYVQKTYRPSLCERLENKLLGLFFKGRISQNYQNALIEKTKEYFESTIKDYDLVVVVGGGIVKWSYQFFYTGLSALLQIGEKLNVPIVFNAVGVEGYNEHNLKCQMLKTAMHLPALVHVSTRDDLETFVNQYYDACPRRPVVRVADPAVWVSEAYGITKKKNDTIGIGIARGRIFQDNGVNVSFREICVLYKAIISRLVDAGYVVEVFTNGLPADTDFAKLVCLDLKADGLVLSQRYPANPYELVEIISSYQAIVATRLHSCIIAYSLDIPAIGLVWNDKLSLFGRNIQAEKNFIKPHKFSSEYVVNQLYEAISKGYDSSVRAGFRQTIIDDIMEVDKKITQITKCKHLLMGGG